MSPESDVVELKIPCKPQFVGVARLVVSGIAGRMGFSYDEVEDIKLAVGEACTGAMQESEAAGAVPPLVLRCGATATELQIHLVTPGRRENCPPEDESASLGQLLMEMLMDEVAVRQEEDGRVSVRMVKRVSRVST